MKMRRLCLFLVLAGLWACDKNQSENCNKAEFKIANIIAPATKAPQLNANGEGAFIAGDTVELFFQTTQQMESCEYSYVYGGRHYWVDLGLPESVESLKLAGCYPKIKTDTPETYAWNVKEKGDKSDLLLASLIEVQQGTSDIIPLTFSHAMHKLVVELIPDGTTITSEMLENANVTCRNVLPVAKVNLLNGSVLGAQGDLSEFSSEGAKGFFIIPAQQIGTIEVAMQVVGNDYVYKLSDCRLDGKPVERLLPGQSLVIKIKVSKGSFTIMGESITGWENQGEVNDSIII